MKRLAFILSLFVALAAHAQQHDKPLVQFSGVIISSDSNNVVPYVTITNTSFKNQVSFANYKGYFSFVAHETDTLRFTSIGYSATVVVIPSGLSNKSYTIKVKLKPESVQLPSVRIFPWATTDEFRKDFLSMKIADDDLEIARKNLTGASIIAMSKYLPRDGKEQSAAFYQNEHTNIVNSHSQTNPLLNPFAWASLIREIAAGDKSRSSSSSSN